MQNVKCYYTNKISVLVGRGERYVFDRSSNADLYVYGHGDADAHDVVRSLTAYPKHTGTVSHRLTCRCAPSQYADHPEGTVAK